ncbi:MAG: MFS transporter, partial [Dehalococcoidales bacterium]
LVNFAIVFIVALAVALVDFIIFTFMYDPKKQEISLAEPVNQNIKFGLFKFIGELKTKKLDTFIIFTSLFYLTVGLGGPLYAVYMLQERHFTYFNYTVIIAVEYLARVISAPFWGRFADKSGNIRVLSVVSRIIPAIPICWLFCSNIGYLAVVQTLSGVCWGAFDLSTQNYIFKVAPPEKKLRYIVYTRSIILFSTALGGLGGVYLIRGIFPIFGSQMLTVFLISGFFRAIVVTLFMPKLVDLAVTYYQPTAPPQVNLDASGKVKVTRNGLFYHRNEPVPVKNTIVNKGVPILSSKPPNIAKRSDWPLEAKPAQKTLKTDRIALEDIKTVPRRNWTLREREAKTMVNNGLIELPEKVKLVPRNWLVRAKAIPERQEAFGEAEVTSSRKPWFRDHDVFNAYTARSRNQSLEEVEKKDRETANREGSLYDSDIFSSYNANRQKQSIAELEKKDRETANREGSIYNSDIFSSYNASRQRQSMAELEKKNRETANREGSIYNSDIFSSYNASRQRQSMAELEKKNRETANRQGSIYNSDIFSSYNASRQKKSVLEMEKNNREKANREGIFYDGAIWANYKRASLQSDIRQTVKQPAADLKPVFVESGFDSSPGAAGTDIRGFLRDRR